MNTICRFLERILHLRLTLKVRHSMPLPMTLRHSKLDFARTVRACQCRWDADQPFPPMLLATMPFVFFAAEGQERKHPTFSIAAFSQDAAKNGGRTQTVVLNTIVCLFWLDSRPQISKVAAGMNWQASEAAWHSRKLLFPRTEIVLSFPLHQTTPGG